MSVGIVGSGRIAQAMGRRLRERGAEVVVAGRDPARTAEAARFIGGCRVAGIDEIAGQLERLLIAVADDALAQVAALLAHGARPGTIALHTCGVHGASVLEPLTEVGVHCGALHPMATVPSPTAGLRILTGASYGFTGGERARAWAAEILESLQGRMYDIPESARALYHAAAALACNSIPGLLDAASTMLAASAGTSKAEALKLLEPLVRASLDNTFELGPEAALTGPVRRGDAATLRLHLQAISTQSPAIGDLYQAIGVWQAELARRAGLDEEELKLVEEAFRNE